MNIQLSLWNDCIPIKFNKIYLLYDDGSVISNLKGESRLLKGGTKKDGYKYYFLQSSQDGTSKWYYAHRLVAEHFIPNPNNLKEVNHKDGNKLNNHVSNLEWINHSDNVKHTYEALERKKLKGSDHWLYGKHHSDETKKLMAEAKMGESHPKFKGYYVINDIPYPSSYEASRTTGIPPRTVYAKCKKGMDGFKFIPKV